MLWWTGPEGTYTHYIGDWKLWRIQSGETKWSDVIYPIKRTWNGRDIPDFSKWPAFRRWTGPRGFGYSRLHPNATGVDPVSKVVVPLHDAFTNGREAREGVKNVFHKATLERLFGKPRFMINPRYSNNMGTRYPVTKHPVSGEPREPHAFVPLRNVLMDKHAQRYESMVTRPERRAAARVELQRRGLHNDIVQKILYDAELSKYRETHPEESRNSNVRKDNKVEERKYTRRYLSKYYNVW